MYPVVVADVVESKPANKSSLPLEQVAVDLMHSISNERRLKPSFDARIQKSSPNRKCVVSMVMLAKDSPSSEIWPIRIFSSVLVDRFRNNDLSRSAPDLEAGCLPSYLDSRDCSVILKQNANRFTVMDATDGLGKYRRNIQHLKLRT